MATITDLHPPGTDEIRDAAMKFLARGDTAEGLRACAADPLYVADLALMSGITLDEARESLLAFAPEIQALEDDGLTTVDCRRLLGWTPEFTAWVLADAARLRAARAARAERTASGTVTAA